MQLPQEKGKYTFGDYLFWSEDFQCELIEGVCYVDGQMYMPHSNQPVALAKPSIMHQRISRNLLLQIHSFLEGKACEVFSEIDVVIAEETGNVDDASTVVSPDITVVCDKSKLKESYCLGTPDMAIEILSRSTMRNDRILKYNLYQKAGIKEYWIVNPMDKTVQVSILENGVYFPKELFGENDIADIHVLPGCSIDLSKVFIE